MMPKVGDPAPDFSLPDQTGKLHKLSYYVGKWILIYFYPKDDTPGCTKEACALRDIFPEFEKLGIKIFGISIDLVKSHERFARKQNLPFALLADENKVVVELYGVWGKKKFMGREHYGTHRISFLINPDGNIQKVYQDVKPAIHAGEVLRDLLTMRR